MKQEYYIANPAPSHVPQSKLAYRLQILKSSAEGLKLALESVERIDELAPYRVLGVRADYSLSFGLLSAVAAVIGVFGVIYSR
jgi:hypothetical protein